MRGLGRRGWAPRTRPRTPAWRTKARHSPEGPRGLETPVSTSETTETAVADLVSVSVAARMLGVSASSLRAWAAAGIVPHRRTTGGHRRFDPRELQQWLAARGGLPPAPTHHAPSELLPTRIDTVPGMSSGIREMGG